MTGKKILITGAGGYIGSVSTYLFLQNGYQVVAIDNYSTGYKEPLDKFKFIHKERFNYYEVDLNNPRAITEILKKEKGIAVVVHYAASCLVNESMKNPQKYFSNNVCATQNLLKTILEAGIKNIVFSSTCAVYGEAEYIPVDEAHPTNPANPYGESKRMIEKMIEWYGRLVGLNYVILRYFNVCGASDDGEVGDSKRPSSLLVQNAIRGALGIEKFYLTCPEVETPDKTPIRDYINVVDLNEAHLKAVKYLLSGGKNEVINLGTGRGNSVLEIIESVEKITGVKLPREKTQARVGEYAKMIADITKAKKVLGWEPKRKIEDSVKSLVTWYKSYPQGWEE